ncbi:MAG TPA: hypothetical protein VHA37_00965, partial [Candidatus Saccharimonadales bacterium]|nr:hypothetical protein [Candidatus Saccharimonadales bacterium]
MERRAVRRQRPQRHTPLLLERLEDRVVLTAWTPIGPAPILNGQIAGSGPVSGRVTGIAADPNNADIVYVATAGGGVWKTTNATAATPNWTPLTDNVTDGSGNPLPEFMGAVAMADATSGAHSGNQIVYAGMGEANNSGDSFYGDGILVSTDGGATWTLTNPGGAFTGKTVSKIVVDPSDSTGATAYAAVADLGVNGSFGSTGIWKTTDFGAHWTNTTAAAGLTTLYPWSDVAIDPNNPSIIYGAIGYSNGYSGNGVYKSTNGGATWTLLNGSGTFNGTQDGRITLAVYDDGSTSELFVSIQNPTTSGLYKMLKSTDGGGSFTDLTSNVLAVSNYLGGQGWYDTTLAIDPQNPNYIYAAGDMSNQGPTFSGSPLESLDGGLTWHDIGTDPAGKGLHTDAHAVAFDANGNVIDGDDGGVFRLSNTNGSLASQRWVDLNSNLATIQFSGIAVDPTNGNVYGGSQDNGTEEYTGAPGWNRILAGDGGIVRIDPTNHSTVYTEQADGNLYVSLNGGTSFNYITPNLLGNSVNFYGPYQVDYKGNLYYGTNDLNFSSNHGTT